VLFEPLAITQGSIEHVNLRLGDRAFIAETALIGRISVIPAIAAGAEPLMISDMAESGIKEEIEGCHEESERRSGCGE
jgi:hypothetical protein